MPFNAHDKTQFGRFFGLVVDGLDIGFFTAVSGLSIEIEKMEQPEMDAHAKMRVITKAPGVAKYGDVVLKRGFTVSTTLTDWFKAVADSKDPTPYKTGSIVLYDNNMKETSRFNFHNMWPSKLSIGDLDAKSNELIVEELTIKHEFLEWV